MTVTLCLVLLMLGSTPSGLSEGPLGRVWLFLPHLVSNPLATASEKASLKKYSPLTLLQGFERLACERMLETEHKLHILTPLLWPSRCVLFSWCWGPLHQGVSECPLGRVWPSLPHLVSSCLEVCWQLLWDPNSTELNNNSTPTRSPTGSLKSNV